MVAGKGRSGRGGGQIGRSGSSTERDGSSAGEREKTKEKMRSDAARIRGSYRYRNYCLASPAAFAKHESERVTPRMRVLPFHGLVVLGVELPPAPTHGVGGEGEEDTEPEPEPPHLPHFAPGDYLDDEQFKLLLMQLGVNVGLAPGDFIAERELDTVVGLVARSSQQDAHKAAEWRHITVEQERVFVDLIGNEE